MRLLWPILLALLTACASTSSEPRQGPEADFESVVRQIAGPDATDCGTTGPRFPSNDVRVCATTQLGNRQPFFAIRYEQGIDSDTGTGWVLDRTGSLFLVTFDAQNCRTVACAVHLAECGKLEIVKDWEWFRPGDCESRTLPEASDFADTSRPPGN